MKKQNKWAVVCLIIACIAQIAGGATRRPGAEVHRVAMEYCDMHIPFGDNDAVSACKSLQLGSECIYFTDADVGWCMSSGYIPTWCNRITVPSDSYPGCQGECLLKEGTCGSNVGRNLSCRFNIVTTVVFIDGDCGC